MKWLKQQRKVETLSRQASVLAAESKLTGQQLHAQTMARLKRPETLIWAFAAGAFWMATPPGNRLSRAQSLTRFATTTSFVLKLFGIPQPFKPLL